MLIVSYDFEKNKPRADFAKFLKKYGGRLQYSVFEVRNSKRVLNNIKKEIELKYKKSFTNVDSIVVFSLCERCEKNLLAYGSAANNDKGMVVFE